MRIRLGNGFLDTRCRPVNTSLDFTWLPLSFRPSFLGVGLVARTGLTPTLLAYCPLSFLLFVWLPSTIYLARCHFRTEHPFTVFLGGRVRCPNWSKADVLLVAACPVGIARGVAARHLWKRSRIAASAARSTGGRSASFTCACRVNLSRISVTAAATPQATVAAKSGVDMVPWAAGGKLALGVTWHKSGPPGAILRPPISMAVSVSVCVLQGEPGVSAVPKEYVAGKHW